MARKSLIVKSLKGKYSVRNRIRCRSENCGRARGVFGRDLFHYCRMCLRKYFSEGKIPG